LTGDVFERFTDRARRAIVLAQVEARLLTHNYIGTEHILLGLLRETEGFAAIALTANGVGLEAVRAAVVELIGEGGDPPGGHIPFTPRSKKVLELALREALELGHNYIGTEHILLGLLREGEGVAVQVIVMLGASSAAIREKTLDLVAAQAQGTTAHLFPQSPVVDTVSLHVDGDRVVVEIEDAELAALVAHASELRNVSVIRGSDPGAAALRRIWGAVRLTASELLREHDE
jgi:ATP-dependent Clp protease ATP-binding subunit ClpC